MGKKKRGHPDVEELLERPWCYYCERDFEDLKLLISHQKAKHFKCERCGKRLNTAGGLSVHMNQVHKESLSSVENALPNRQGLDIEIFGMEGVPEDVLQQHNQRIIQNFYTAQAERQAATGNPPRGNSGGQGPTKKIKIETPEELKKRLAEHRAKVAAQKAAAANGTPLPVTAPADGQSPSQGASPFPPPQPGFPYSATPVTPYPPGGQGYPASTYPAGASVPPGASFGSLPARPPGGAAPPGAPSALPQRPPYAYNGSAPPAGFPAGGGVPSTVDELVASAAATGGRVPGGDDIDQLIRLAEAGIKPAKTDDATAAASGGEKKKKGMRMVYDDTDVSPEEKMALLPRYRWAEETAA
ncbi:putative zinc finger protein [Cladorrhinum samala]|uniref:Zinc finger protein n=1 Tax=Cladorrhinum samala TaxID=585594 RepID=A0AAV9HX58_9PEZI|nr:putative zinc finger protein [Cladorrhinum samala]